MLFVIRGLCLHVLLSIRIDDYVGCKWALRYPLMEFISAVLILYHLESDILLNMI